MSAGRYSLTRRLLHLLVGPRGVFPLPAPNTVHHPKGCRVFHGAHPGVPSLACRRNDYPRLWSSLFINLRETVCEAHRRGYETWLARAKSVPLAVRTLNDINAFTDPTLVSSVILWLRPLITQSNDIWWHGPSLPTLFAPDAGTDLLERLRFTSHRDTASTHFLGPAKRLRSASLQCLNCDLQSLNGQPGRAEHAPCLVRQHGLCPVPRAPCSPPHRHRLVSLQTMSSSWSCARSHRGPSRILSCAASKSR